MGRGSLISKQDRRDRLIGLLRSDDIWTTAKLAADLGVSHRTLMRDLEELRAVGYPLETDRGRGGGVRLTGRWGIERLTLSNQEVISLLASLAVTESLSPSLIATQSKGIRQKIASAFPASQRKIINQFRRRILVGGPASPAVMATYGRPLAPIMEIISTAFFESRKLVIRYRSEKQEHTSRVIEPQYLLLNWPIWYLLCWDELRQDVRNFRTDRIRSVGMTNETMKRRKKALFLDAFADYFSQI